jgi:hypothetical protein
VADPAPGDRPGCLIRVTLPPNRELSPSM